MTVNEQVKTVYENERIYIPIGALHRLENPGKILLALIEVQTGSYLGENDKIRIEDDYSGVEGSKDRSLKQQRTPSSTSGALELAGEGGR